MVDWKKQKLLSVVIPAYNVERYLEGCLSSMLVTRQAEKTELIVVDDGSRDGTAAMADAYAEKYPETVKVIHKENGGHGSAVNAGIAAAQGFYFKVVDGDDSVEPEEYDRYLTALLKKAEEHCDLIATPFTCVWYDAGTEEVRKTERRNIEGTENLPEEKVLSFETVADLLHIRMHEWTIRTEILKEHDIRLSEHSFYVDMQYILYPVPWIRTVCILSCPVYRYRLGSESQSVSVKSMQKNRAQHREVLRSLVRFYREREAAGDDSDVLFYLARGIAKMEANQVQIALGMKIGKTAKEELVSAEDELKEICPAAYQANEKKSIELLRKSRYTLYPAAAVLWRMVKR